jgi:putative tryptophan/tyrosine transport system substrate-binding protein
LRCSRKLHPMSPRSWRSCTSKMRYIRPFGNRSRMQRSDWQSRLQQDVCKTVSEIADVIASFSQKPNVGLVALPHALTIFNAPMIIALAQRYRIPCIYAQAEAVAIGGLISYGLSWNDQFRRVADYVDRVLKGTRPADLPVQEPTKYQLAVNLKTAKALGLDVPPMLLARADEVIE